MASHKIKVTSNHNPAAPRDFVARLVKTGDLNGPFFKKENANAAVVEIYDNTYDWARDPVDGEVLGQLASSYYLADLLDRRDGRNAGIDLHGGVDVWKIDREAFAQLFAAMETWEAEVTAEQEPAAGPGM